MLFLAEAEMSLMSEDEMWWLLPWTLTMAACVPLGQVLTLCDCLPRSRSEDWSCTLGSSLGHSGGQPWDLETRIPVSGLSRVTLDQWEPGLAAVSQSERVTRPALAEVNTLGRCCCGHSSLRPELKHAPHGRRLTRVMSSQCPPSWSPHSDPAVFTFQAWISLFPWVLHCPAREASSWLPSVRQLQDPVKGSLMASFQPIRTRPRAHWPISCQAGQAPHSALMPGSEKLKPGSGVQVSGVTGQEASDGEDRIRPIRGQQYPQWPMGGESWERSPTPDSRPASMDLATEAWRPRGRWAGTRRPGPHQTQPLAWDLCTNGRPAPGLAPASSENTPRGKKMLSSFQKEKYHFLAHLSRNLNKFLCSASHPTNIAPLHHFEIHFNKKQPRHNQSEKQVGSLQLNKS